MLLSELQAAVYDECLYGSSPATAVTTRVTRYLNDGLRLVLSEPGLSRMVDSDDPLSIASVASQARYVVPESVASIRKISERTNDRTLSALSWDAYRRMEPDPASVTGTPTHYVLGGRVAAAVQPTAATELFVKSTSASDTGTAFVEGIITDGYRRTTSGVMTGTTQVTVGSSITTFIQVEDFYLSANAVGTVTLWQGTTGAPPTLTTQLAQITIGQKRPRYQAFYLWPTPAAVVSYLVDYRREIVDLANATDEPNLPPDYHQMLVDYAVAREYELKNDQARVKLAMGRYTFRLERLKYQTQWATDELPVSNNRLWTGHSRLGGMFPADYWTRG